MTLDQVLKEITHKVTCVDFHEDRDRKDWFLAPTGETFLTLYSGGLCKEGEAPPCLCYTEQSAIDIWRLALMDYAARTPGVLYWRQKPQMMNALAAESDGHESWFHERLDREFIKMPVFYIYSRLLISDRPALRAYSRAA